MRERFIHIIITLIVLILGILGTLYFTSNKNTNTVVTNKKVTIKESGSINESVEKIYNAVVVVENYNGDVLTATGSGFVYKKDSKYGYIMTNYHVVDGAKAIKIVTMSNEEVDAEYLGGDSYADLAVIRIDAEKVLEVAQIGDSTKAKLGDTVFTVGTPVNSEYMGSVTKGIISGEDRTITVNDNSKGNYMMEVLQTDASINPGNSGGPLVNINGEVIGITSMKLVTDEIEGMGFAIPIEVAMASIDKLESGKEIARPYIGVSLYDINSSAMLFRFDLKIDDNIKSGVIVANIEEGSPAKEAGLQKNDIILKVDDKTVKSTAHFKFLLYKHDIGDTATLTINRDGKEKTIEIKLSKSLGE
ncbi:MAG: trypsin-like peptidase domain-containing protein [Bacilli bacterium]|nr:trypsin-like peptidase domain-containing protein [Bacilli bacterium]